MWKNLSYKRKNLLLIGSVMAFAFIVYSLAIDKTVTLADECAILEKELETAGDAPNRIALLKQQIAETEQTIGKEDQSTGDTQQELLERISRYCNANNVVLKELPQPVTVVNEDYVIETTVVTLEGGFIKILKLMYEFEQHSHNARVAAVHFQSKRDLKEQRTFLIASLYLQNVKKKSNAS